MLRSPSRFFACASLLLAACSGSRSEGGERTSHFVEATSDQTLVAAAGTTLRIPSGSLDADTAITVHAAPAIRRPGDAVVVATPVRLGPEGQTFHHAVEIELPIEPSAIPAGKTVDDVVVLRAPQGTNAYVPLPTRRGGAASVVAITEHFSDFVAVVVTGPAAIADGCGDAMCVGSETCSTCSIDCGLCLGANECGNATCDAAETCSSCAFDCTCPIPMDGGQLPIDAGPPTVCTGANAPIDGTVSATTATFPDSITYDCDPGFSVVGLLTRACQSDGTFAGVEPTCVPSTTTVYVAATGLEWQLGVDPGTYDWTAATTFCGDLVLGGRDDWRLPVLEELISVTDYTTNLPAIDGAVFPGTPLGYYATSTDGSAAAANTVWVVHINYGQVMTYSTATPIRVRCVRTSVPRNAGLVDNTDGTVTDAETGLVWQQVTDAGTYMQAAGATYCAGLDLGGVAIGTWRLPTVAELHSIVDTTRTSPSIDPVAFPGTGVGFHWSSTVNPDNALAYYAVRFTDGADTYTFSDGLLTIRCVH